MQCGGTHNLDQSSMSSESEPRRRGRPVDQEISKRILTATVEIVATAGYTNLTVDEVARRAGVPKSTMYQRWPSKGLLLAEALGSSIVLRPSTEIDTGSVRGDLEALLKADIAVVLQTGPGRIITGLLTEALTNVEAALLVREKIMAPRRRAYVVPLQRGIARGQVDPAADLDAAVDMTLGALWYRLLSGLGTLDNSFASELATLVAGGLQP